MVTKTIEIKNILGLCARPCAMIVQICNKSKCKISFENKERDYTASGHHIMELLMLAASCGTMLDCTVDGPGEVEVLQSLEDCIDSLVDSYGESYFEGRQKKEDGGE